VVKLENAITIAATIFVIAIFVVALLPAFVTG
jgi:hypothetical protein